MAGLNESDEQLYSLKQNHKSLSQKQYRHYQIQLHIGRGQDPAALRREMRENAYYKRAITPVYINNEEGD